jgi:hypothetical protein
MKHWPVRLYKLSFFPVRCSPQWARAFLINEASRSHSDTSNSVELLWMSDQSGAETSTKQQATFTRDGQQCPWRDSNPQSEQVSGRNPRPFTLIMRANKTEKSDVFNSVNANSECQGKQNVWKLCISVRSALFATLSCYIVPACLNTGSYNKEF